MLSPPERTIRGPTSAPETWEELELPVLRWMHESVWAQPGELEHLGDAKVSTRIFEQPHTRAVALELLRVRVERARRTRGREHRPPARTSELSEPAESAAEGLRPITPRRELDELMDDVLFTPGCGREYERAAWAAVPPARRFDIVLPRMPTADAPVTVKGLYYPGRRASRRRRRLGPGGRQAA